MSNYLSFSGKIKEDGASAKLEYNTKLFSKKLTKCSNNCTLRVYYNDIPPAVMNANEGMLHSNYFINQGFDMNLLNLIAVYLNLTLQYTKSGSDWGQIFKNGTVTGNVALLSNNSADILIGGYIKTVDRLMYFDTSDTHMQQYLVWCVPHDPIPVGFRSMTSLFTKELWILIVLTYILLSSSIWILSLHHTKESASYRTFQEIVFNTAAVLLGVAVNSLPKSTRVRYFMTMLIIFGFHITLIYSGYLTGIISAPKYVQKINSIRDIYNYKMKTYFLPADIRIIEKNKITEVPKNLIKKRWRDCPNVSWCFKKVATTKTHSFFTNNLRQEYFAATMNYSIHCIRHSAIPIHIGIIMRKGFPFFRQFNKVIRYVIQAGFMSKWEKDLLKTKHPNIENVEESFIKFSNLRPIFNFLLIGNAVAFIMFLIEILVYKYAY